MDPSETKRPQSGPAFHKHPFWHIASGLDQRDHDRFRGPLGLHKLEKGLLRVMGLRRRRHSSASERASAQRQSRRVSSEVRSPTVLASDEHFSQLIQLSLQEIVQFRKVKLPSSNSYDGSAEKTAREFASSCPISHPSPLQPTYHVANHGHLEFSRPFQTPHDIFGTLSWLPRLPRQRWRRFLGHRWRVEHHQAAGYVGQHACGALQGPQADARGAGRAQLCAGHDGT